MAEMATVQAHGGSQVSANNAGILIPYLEEWEDLEKAALLLDVRQHQLPSGLFLPLIVLAGEVVLSHLEHWKDMRRAHRFFVAWARDPVYIGDMIQSFPLWYDTSKAGEFFAAHMASNEQQNLFADLWDEFIQKLRFTGIRIDDEGDVIEGDEWTISQWWPGGYGQLAHFLRSCGEPSLSYVLPRLQPELDGGLRHFFPEWE
jgi:hypothetical protein